MPQRDICTAFDRRKITSLKLETHQEVQDKLHCAQLAFEDQDNWLPKYTRIEILDCLISLIQSRKENLILTAAEEGGKPYLDSCIEVERGIEGIKTAITELRQFTGKEIPMGITPNSAQRLAFTIQEPRGVVLGISAFNHPFNLIIHQVIPAIAVGCPVLIKPASDTPLSCKALVELIHQAGLPKPWCQMIFCDNEVTTEIVKDNRISFLSFIGSASVGWKLRSLLPPGAACALEHGGVAPVIIEKSSDISAIVPSLVKGSFYHAGQVCVSVQRIYLDESIMEEFCEAFVDKVRKLKVGDPTDPATEVGPLIRPSEVARVGNWIDEAISAGATLLCGGQRLSDTCFQPTVLLDPPDNVSISQKEVFGPVVCIYPFKDRVQAINRANSLNVAFQASVYSKDIDIALETAKKLKGLAVMINDHPAFRVDWMPFGGYKDSGLGVGGIGYSMREMSIEKLLVVHSLSL